MHNTTWAPNTMLSFRKNQRASSKKTSEQKYRPYMTLLAMARSPIRECVNWEALIQLSLAYLINLEIYLNLSYEITYN